MSEQSKEQTPTPWKVYERKLPFMLGDKPRFHTERIIGTEADHPQLKGPYPVVTISTGLGMESGQIQTFVSLSESDARRIVACVNACAGLDTEFIEQTNMLGLEKSYSAQCQANADIWQQRNELLTVLKETKKALETANFSQPSPITDTLWMTKSETLFDFIDAAIAKAEQS